MRLSLGFLIWKISKLNFRARGPTTQLFYRYYYLITSFTIQWFLMPDYPPKNKKRELLEALKNKVGEAELSERGSMGLFVTTLEEMGMKGKAYRVKVGADVSLEGFEELKYDYYIVVGNLPLSFGMGRGDEGKVITMEGSLTISPDQLQHMLVQGTAQECTEECLQAYRKERPKQN